MIEFILNLLRGFFAAFRQEQSKPIQKPQKSKILKPEVAKAEPRKAIQMANYELAYAVVRDHEGGYTDNIADKGNWICPATGGWVRGSQYPYWCDSGREPVLIGTNYGVAAPNLIKILGRIPTSKADSRNITKTQVKEFFYKEFWWKNKIDLIHDQSVATILFDGVIQHTVGVRLMQEVLGVTADNIVGGETLNAINMADPRKLFFDYKARREQYYRAIVDNNPGQQVFFNGWMRRINSFVYSAPAAAGSGLAALLFFIFIFTGE